MSSLRSPVSRGSDAKPKVRRRRVPLPRLDLTDGNYHALEENGAGGAAKFTSGIIYGLVNDILIFIHLYIYKFYTSIYEIIRIWRCYSYAKHLDHILHI